MTDPQNSDEYTVTDLAGREPGEDSQDSHENTVMADLPAWWQDAIREYDDCNLRAFRPSRFADGVVVESLLSGLEAKHDVVVSLYGDGTGYGDPWTLSVDGHDVAKVGHRRSPDGYSVFSSTSDRIVDLVTEHAAPSSG